MPYFLFAHLNCSARMHNLHIAHLSSVYVCVHMWRACVCRCAVYVPLCQHLVLQLIVEDKKKKRKKKKRKENECTEREKKRKEKKRKRKQKASYFYQEGYASVDERSLH